MTAMIPQLSPGPKLLLSHAEAGQGPTASVGPVAGKARSARLLIDVPRLSRPVEILRDHLAA
ncbi:hypothetical protein [Methylobacterium sp. J-067]|uniref:hypothetical protein n=1 Tax=Methylobacterium sp. J-067 TaxID=2836648 RepID=UPI001FB99F49|nr:hypothetical protein [Methylobacterium sp. J-067]MCJ2025953.1 hypothetical protein [Methylobacterium sp. J-067]